VSVNALCLYAYLNPVSILVLSNARAPMDVSPWSVASSLRSSAFPSLVAADCRRVSVSRDWHRQGKMPPWQRFSIMPQYCVYDILYWYRTVGEPIVHTRHIREHVDVRWRLYNRLYSDRRVLKIPSPGFDYMDCRRIPVQLW